MALLFSMDVSFFFANKVLSPPSPDETLVYVFSCVYAILSHEGTVKLGVIPLVTIRSVHFTLGTKDGGTCVCI